VTGDLSQVDLPRGTRSGLLDALETLREVSEIAIVEFTEADVVRHPLVARIVGAYDARDRRRAALEDDPS
jgi:phosphate starvation-inducible protein PhoH and related proteins